MRGERIEHIIIVTGKGKNSIEDHFELQPDTGTVFWRKRDAKIRRPWCGKLATWWQVSYTRQKKSRWDWGTR